jgi:hypothetical protein
MPVHIVLVFKVQGCLLGSWVADELARKVVVCVCFFISQPAQIHTFQMAEGHQEMWSCITVVRVQHTTYETPVCIL